MSLVVLDSLYESIRGTPAMTKLLCCRGRHQSEGYSATLPASKSSW